MMPPMIRLTFAILTILLCLGCTEERTAEVIQAEQAANAKRAAALQPSAEEHVLLERLARDPFMIIETWERDENKHLVVTTAQGRELVRYVFKPAQIDEKTLTIHRINDRAVLDIGQSDQLGTGPRRP